MTSFFPCSEGPNILTLPTVPSGWTKDGGETRKSSNRCALLLFALLSASERILSTLIEMQKASQ